MRKYIVGILAWCLYKLISSTWKVTLDEPPELKRWLAEKKPFILAHWHGDEVVLTSLLGRYRLATIVSTSQDGDMMSVIIHLMGARSSRGSSTRGGIAALKGLLRMMKEGHNCSFAVDGPKGPIYKAKPGVFETSRLAQAPIFYSGIYCENKKIFEKSWNKMYLPKPFSKVHIKWFGPLPAISKDTDPRDKDLALHLEGLLHGARAEVQSLNEATPK